MIARAISRACSLAREFWPLASRANVTDAFGRPAPWRLPPRISRLAFEKESKNQRKSFRPCDLQLKAGDAMGAKHFIFVGEVIDDGGALAFAKLHGLARLEAFEYLLEQLVGFFVRGFAFVAQGEDLVDERFGALGHEFDVFRTSLKSPDC